MWNISWVLLRDFDSKIEDVPRRCEIYATPDDRRPKSQWCPRLSGTVQVKMKISCQELRVHKISLQFVAPSGCQFYNPTTEKTLFT